VLKLPQIFTPPGRLCQLQAEVKRLRRENALLQAQNDSMRAGMRRCVSCEYRIDFMQRQGREAPAGRRPGNGDE